MKEFDLVRRYLDKKMSQEEILAFENLLEEEGQEELRKELENQKIERAAVQLLQEDYLRSIIQGSEKRVLSNPDPGKTRRITAIKILLTSAAAVVLILIAIFFMLRPRYSNLALAISNNQFEITATMGADNSEAAKLESGKLLLDSAKDEDDYLRAIQVFREVVEFPNLARYYIGHCYFQLGDYSNAALNFQNVVDLNEDAGNFQDPAKWYLVLSKLALGKLDADFDSLLTELVESGNSDAERLQRQLNSLFRIY